MGDLNIIKVNNSKKKFKFCFLILKSYVIKNFYFILLTFIHFLTKT